MSIRLLRDLWTRVLGTTPTGASPSLSGSLAQQVAYGVRAMRMASQYRLLGPVTVTAGAGTYGSWVEVGTLDTATPIYALLVTYTTGTGSLTVQLGQGQAGSELILLTMPVGTAAQGYRYYPLYYPLFNSHTRLVARAMSTFGTPLCGVALMWSYVSDIQTFVP